MSIWQTAITTLFRINTKYDLSAFDHPDTGTRPIYGFYHVFCATGWENLVSLQMDRLRRSGLAEATKKLYISIITEHENDLHKLNYLLHGINYEIVFQSSNSLKFEFPALEAIKEDCLIYYFHTKGESYHGQQNQERHWLYFKKKIEVWRNVMEYFNFDHWQVAANVLESGYDTYGCLRYPPKPAQYTFYAGNFWWANSKYLRKLKTTPANKHVGRKMALYHKTQ